MNWTGIIVLLKFVLVSLSTHAQVSPLVSLYTLSSSSNGKILRDANGNSSWSTKSWKELGILLGQDINWLEGLEDECNRKASRCWCKVISYWLAEGGTPGYPATWESLLIAWESLLIALNMQRCQENSRRHWLQLLHSNSSSSISNSDLRWATKYRQHAHSLCI